jgi:glycosyltransferase involved in cell wall biosynthesis
VYAAYLIRTWAFAEIHAHFADRAATIALVASRLVDTPYSLSIHAAADIFVKPVLLREKLLAARRVVTCTEHNRRHLSSLTGTPIDAISTVLHGLDLTEYPPSAGTVKADPPLILSVAQLTERKGLATLVLACRELVARGYRFRCEIVGRGRQEAELAALIRRHSLEDRVVLCGPLPHEQVVERYRRATAFALPCRTGPDGDVDGIPNVIAEAMASGVPVVSTDLPAIRELVTDGVDGLLVEADDPAALAERIGDLLDRPALRAELASRGRQTVEEIFDAEANVRRFAATLWPDVFAPETADA